MNPESVAGQEVGGLCDGQSDVPALYVNVDIGSGKVESRAIGVQSGCKKKAEQQEQQTTTHSFYCTNSQRLSERRGALRIAGSNAALMLT